MRKILFLGAIISLLFVQCGKDSKDNFTITSGAIGNLTKTTKIKQLDSIFATDSLVKINSSPNALETQGEVEVFEKGGKKLLLLSPKDELDPNSIITDVLIYDSRYKTEKGLTKENTFKDFKDAYTIESIERIINGVLVFFNDTDVYLTIESKHLTEDAPNVSSIKLTADHIKDDAPIKYLRLNW